MSTSLPASVSSAPSGVGARGVVRTIVWLALGLGLARVIYLAFFCPYTLVEDEAQYWVWSRHLAWSYYTKGPGVAWVIAAATRLLGDAEWVIRLPAVVCGVVTVVVSAVLARDMFEDRVAVSRTAWCAILSPVYLAMSLVMTIDPPLVACWAVAAWAAWRAVGMGGAWGLVLFGAAVGVGVLFKYTMLLLLPGVVVWTIVRGREGRLGRPAAAWGAAGVALMLVAFLPVVLWNQEHGWPTVRHLLGHLGVEGGDVAVTQGKDGWAYNPVWTLEYVGMHVGLVGPVLVLAVLGAIDAWRRRGVEPQAWRCASFLIACAAPIYIFYLLVSFTARTEGNWPIAGSVTLLPLAGRHAARWWEGCSGGGVRTWLVPRRWNTASTLWVFTVVIGAGVALCTLRLDLMTRAPLFGKYIPIGRMTGARDMGVNAQELVEQLRTESGGEPFVIASHYGRASILSYYMPGRPDVWCASSRLPGGRVTAWDFWPEMSLENPALIGRPAVVVGQKRSEWRQVFDSVGAPVHLAGDHKVDKKGRATRPAFKAVGYRGFPAGGVKEESGKSLEGGAP